MAHGSAGLALRCGELCATRNGFSGMLQLCGIHMPSHDPSNNTPSSFFRLSVSSFEHAGSLLSDQSATMLTAGLYVCISGETLNVRMSQVAAFVEEW
jgi:hypothetical protein